MKTSLVAMIALVWSFTLNAESIFHAPKTFKAAEGQVVFIDIKTADYSVTYDPKTKKVMAQSILVFETKETGMVAFDLVENPTSMSLDGEAISSKVISSPDKDTWFRIALKNTTPGLHKLEISSPITQSVSFGSEGVSSAFWFTDLGDRSYLEAYLPANFEFDQYQITLNLDFKTMNKQKIYTNGKVTTLENNRYRIEFPETYTSSSLYFHTAWAGRYNEKSFVFKSLDGRELPAIVYTGDKSLNLESIKTKITQSLDALETKYGPFLHQSVTVFIAGSGGMEYCGATMTDVWALNHELTHSYFARGGFMPANGNSGWIDEAITTWSDTGASTLENPNNIRSNMAGNSEYRRYTHIDAYTQGKNFMAYLNYKYQASGGLSAFLNQLISSESFRPMTTEEFVGKMSDFYSEDLMPLFKKHTYSGKSVQGTPGEHPIHMKMTIQEMRSLL
ncbi:hypothetical protein DOM21_14240 [Bacteriovorax stolpii]|uniref:M1 family metallopeptidase n=1 Tax=Bacteriovorax stolpii TaxID=960 RepID=UPI001156F37A|nr:M1 family metallopeptidase [Bacteriovorax stolpii]QDK42589.1 hypothetical protein DOM21_14240 [Bacteriovorax stolpii]